MKRPRGHAARGQGTGSRDAQDSRHGEDDLDLLTLSGVVLVMAFAMVCATVTLAAAPDRTLIRAGQISAVHPLMFFGDGHLRVRTALFGLVFVAWTSIALVATRAWHGVHPERRTALRSAASVGLGQTLILLAAAASTSFTGVSSWGNTVGYFGLNLTASVLGAYVVVRATRLVTGRPEPLLSRAMFLWAAGWVVVQQVREHSMILATAAEALASGMAPGDDAVTHVFAPQLVLAWQLPMGVAVAAWFARVRSPAARPLKTRAEGALAWGKATVVVSGALLLMWVAIMAVALNHVSVDEAAAIPPSPADFVDE